MCGRFWIDSDTAKEIEKTIRMVDEKLKMERHSKDIHPTEKAPVISYQQGSMLLADKKWGFPGFDSGKVIFNARAESVLEKKMFRESVLKRRLVIPAAGFYEWNRKKEKVAFTSAVVEQPILYMAGFYNKYGNEDRFVILTTGANGSMADVHERMPLLLKNQELEEWLREDKRLEEFLHSESHGLRRKMEYEQQTLSFL
ncbi:MAG: SOS response-associated peptidase family protein [Lachnospiraceae bacterium]|nr:SOS response-associated peptidase family protein [Lachnospiraceae bacterium]